MLTLRRSADVRPLNARVQRTSRPAAVHRRKSALGGECWGDERRGYENQLLQE